MLVHVLVIFAVGQRLGPFIAGKGEQIVGDDALVGGVRRRDLLPGGQVDNLAVPGLDRMIAGKFQCVGLVEHQIIPGEGDAVILFKGEHFGSGLIVEGAAAAGGGAVVGPGHPVIGDIALRRVVHQCDGLIAPALMEDFAAAEDGGAVGIIQDPQLAVVESGGSVAGLFYGNRVFPGGCRRQQGTAGEQGNRQRQAGGGAAKAKQRGLHGRFLLKFDFPI